MDDTVLDARGLSCPLPVLRARKAMRALAPGAVLRLLATDPGAVPDMEAWERQTRHELVQVEELGEDLFRFLVRKTH